MLSTEQSLQFVRLRPISELKGGRRPELGLPCGFQGLSTHYQVPGADPSVDRAISHYTANQAGEFLAVSKE